MRISARADYAVCAALQLAASRDDGPLKAEAIADAQDILRVRHALGGEPGASGPAFDEMGAEQPAAQEGRIWRSGTTDRKAARPW
jgi:hypothetical protein